MKEDKSPFFFFCLFATIFLAVFYYTATNMAGVYIVSDLGGGNHISIYTMIFYGLGNALGVPLAKPLSARFGPARTLVFCLLLYTLFTTLCSSAPTFFVLNVYRLFLGLSSGPFYIIVSALLNAYAPPLKKSSYVSIMVTQFAVVPVIATGIGAWMAYESHWRWIFYLNQPLSLFLAGYFWLVLRPEDPPREKMPPFDWMGLTLYAVGVSSIVTAGAMAQQLDWFRSHIFSTLVYIGIPALILFVIRELRQERPLLELKLLKSFTLSYALFNLAFLFSAYFGMIILIVLWLNIYVNYTPIWIAYLMGMMGLAGILAYFLCKKWMDYFDPRTPLALSILFFAASCYYSIHFNTEIDLGRLAIARMLSGVGLVLFLPPIFRLSIKSHGEEKSEEVFALFQVVRSVGSSLGAGLYIILWQRRQVFFHERLGEKLTRTSEITAAFFEKAIHRFHLTKEQAVAQLDVSLENQATSLALNDAFGFMLCVMIALFLLLCLTFFLKPFSLNS